MIPPEIIEQVRDAVDMIQLIGESVELKKTGSDWRGPCPFHGGTHRNFSVVPKKQMYHCFVCHESGDIFTYFMKKFGLAYPEAVKEIAGRVGVVIPESKQAQGPDPNEPLYSALGVAAEWFQRKLREDDQARIAREYLAERGITDLVRDEFGLGYAPPGRDAFLDSMRTMGLTDDVLINAGLAMRREDGRVGARFWGRLLFPIADVRGRVVGFGGRILGEGEPKYLNSPESSVFHKGTVLYLLDRARNHIRTEGFAIVVEGYVDAIRLHAAGIACAVAPLGTALTAEQSKVLRRYTSQVVLAYDADAPGLKSTFRAGDELLRHGASVQVVTMPAGEDPDTLVRAGGEPAFRKLIAEAVDLFDLKIKLLDRKNMFTGIKERRRALDRLLPTIRAAADPVTREQYIAAAAARTGMRAEVIAQEASKRESHLGESAVRAPAEPAVRLPRLAEIPHERDLIWLMRTRPELLERAARELLPEQFRHAYYAEMAAVLLGKKKSLAEELVPLWENLGAPPDAGFDAEAEFAGAVIWIRKRPRQERAAEIDGISPMASEEEKDRLFQEKKDLASSGDLKFSRKSLKAEREPL